MDEKTETAEVHGLVQNKSLESDRFGNLLQVSGPQSTTIFIIIP